ncbi:hypothetical protein AUJ66_01095 [Candidatus Desantisbacteria bacterium CG1_02_38_46]|uniref:Dihydrodipicolinate reductase n=3 Tax=unclassified Candidatus Desantisiibacteriota TaxID=3106372 RepID=A0A2H9PD80_9BACT|nr:MAG: hypothetical protein AUJ66_01095 [Candidatus Desantisbacteria bacterium CG1_02_38_46]PIU52145.1 MAG: dihydrodipicolinate reductase [Candidatus Desantisbacteria bacterium CG07_land_8_20_14_0_80_39_15]PIZ17417.1 MAG: dihydrodipicolinate reductase [Candidatus Desantisbacteria bacterium CG_4_10_14_0_8_um_filter_39_17]
MSSQRQIKIIQIGLGPIGQKITKYIVERKGIEIVAVVDPAVDKAGKNLSELCSLDKDLGIKVLPDIGLAMQDNKPDVALLTTFSSLEKIIPQVEEIAKYGVNIVSTCEELSFPWDTQPELAKKLDEIAKANNISLLGTGVNPGFLMDFLPIVLSGVCQQVKQMRVSRIQDAITRRIPFQKKIGVGLTLEEFEEKRRTGTLRHVGLTESMHMIARKIGWRLEKTEDILTPVVAESEVSIGDMRIKPGMALGVQQTGKGYFNGEEVITLIFRASAGEKNPADTIEIKGIPDITCRIPGGINGDIATCAITINAISSITGLSGGLKTMADIPVVSFWQ